MRPVDTTAAARLLRGLRPDLADPAASLRDWTRRGLLDRRGKDARGRVLYDLDDVERVAAAITTRRRPGVRRAAQTPPT